MSDWLKLQRRRQPALAYRCEGAGKAVVLVHGVGGDSGNWDAIASLLARRYRAIRLDLRGHGRSEPILAPCEVSDLARDVSDVMDAVGVAAACVAGFSLGGAVAQSLALDSPKRVEKLALISTVAGRTDAERTGAVSRIGILREKGLAAIAAANRDRWFTDEFQRTHPGLVEARVNALLDSDPNSYLHAYTVFATTDLAHRLDEIRAPTLLVTGEHDVAATPRMAKLMHERIKHSQLHILPGLRHSLLIEAPDTIAPLLDRFFA